MKTILSAMICFFTLFFLSACAQKQVIYKEVKVPIKCDIPKREKPSKKSNNILYLKEVLIYAELLEKDLDFCRGEGEK